MALVALFSCHVTRLGEWLIVLPVLLGGKVFQDGRHLRHELVQLADVPIGCQSIRGHAIQEGGLPKHGDQAPQVDRADGHLAGELLSQHPVDDL